MFTSLDLLIIAFMVLTAVALMSLGFMFFLKNRKLQNVSFYFLSVITVYLAYIGIRIGYLLSSLQLAVGICVLFILAGAFLVKKINKGNEKIFLTARIISASALLMGFVNLLAVLWFYRGNSSAYGSLLRAALGFKQSLQRAGCCFLKMLRNQ